jgi:hypothetical protein
VVVVLEKVADSLAKRLADSSALVGSACQGIMKNANMALWTIVSGLSDVLVESGPMKRRFFSRLIGALLLVLAGEV